MSIDNEDKEASYYEEVINFFEKRDKDSNIFNFILSLLERVRATPPILEGKVLTFILDYLKFVSSSELYDNQGEDAEDLSNKEKECFIHILEQEYEEEES